MEKPRTPKVPLLNKEMQDTKIVSLYSSCHTSSSKEVGVAGVAIDEYG